MAQQHLSHVNDSAVLCAVFAYLGLPMMFRNKRGRRQRQRRQGCVLLCERGGKEQLRSTIYVGGGRAAAEPGLMCKTRLECHFQEIEQRTSQALPPPASPPAIGSMAKPWGSQRVTVSASQMPHAGNKIVAVRTIRRGDLDAFKRGDGFRSFNCSKAASSAAMSIASNMDAAVILRVADGRREVNGLNPEGEEAAAVVVSNIAIWS